MCKLFIAINQKYNYEHDELPAWKGYSFQGPSQTKISRNIAQTQA